MENKTYTIQNHPFFELKVTELPNDALDITQITYDRDGVIEELGNVVISKWAFDRIRNSKLRSKE